MIRGKTAPWGKSSKWGLTAGPSPETLCDLAKARVWSWTPQDGNTVDFLCALGAVQNGLFIDTLNTIKAAWSLDSATGDRLDRIGEIIGLPRSGYSDDRYRLFLRIQALIILARADDEQPRPGSHEGLIRIARTFIGSGVVAPIVLLNTWPYGFVMSVPGVTFTEAQQLARFLTQAVDAGVSGLILFEDETAGAVWDDSRVTITGTTAVWDDSRVAVAGTLANWGYAIPIGAP